jgi:gentisate 1,2-dioxygenase
VSTNLIKRKPEMERRPLEQCHGGVGAVDWTNVLSGDDLPGRHLRFFHDDVLPPGASVGVHDHEDDEECYYILSGSGVMTLDGERTEVGAGDIAVVFPGGSHGLENTSDGDLRFLVVSVA